MAARVLVIDDEPMIVEALRALLSAMGYDVEGHSDALAGRDAALAGDYDLVLADLRMPGRNGAEVVADVLAARPGTRLLIMTAYPEDPLAAKALEVGALAVVRKPFEIAKILGYIRDSPPAPG